MAAPKLLHVLGGGRWQVPTVRLAKELGYRVLVTDMYDKPPAYEYADVCERIDIADVDATLRAAERHRIDAIVCDTTDVGVPTMARVAEALGLPGIGVETAINFTNKVRMRERTAAAGIPSPPFRLVHTRAELHAAARDIAFPLVIKPVDGQASRGVHVVRTLAQADAAYDDAVIHSRSAAVIAEGFIEGTELTVEGYCEDFEPRVLAISEKSHFVHRPAVASRLTYPALLTEAIRHRVIDVNRRVVSALGLRTGVTHGEYMVGTDGQIYLVEIAARGAGTGVYSHIVPYLAGFSLPEYYLRYLFGESVRATPQSQQRAAVLAFFDVPPGRVAGISGVEEARALPGVQEISLALREGDLAAPPLSDTSRHGHVVVFGQTRADVLETTDRVFNTVQFAVQA